jgi:hypothetical protein
MVEATLSESRIGELVSGLRGRVIRAGDGDYDEARRVWNAMIDRRPALIVRPAVAADVIAAVNFARDNALIISVRSGGHNIAGNCVCDGGMAIDFSDMKAISVDPGARTATAEPGVKWGEFDAATQAHGLATTGGTNTDTGIGGLTTGGGIGWLGGKYGLASDNLLSADVVTADGRLIRASAEKNQDLFWALRGGGGNFGVVTLFTYRLHPVGPLLAGILAHPLAEAKKVMRFYKEWERGMPDELRCYPALLHNPEAGAVLGVAVCYNGPIEEGEEVLAPLRKFGPPVMDVIGPMPYTAVQGRQLLRAGADVTGDQRRTDRPPRRPLRQSHLAALRAAPPAAGRRHGTWRDGVPPSRSVLQPRYHCRLGAGRRFSQTYRLGSRRRGCGGCVHDGRQLRERVGPRGGRGRGSDQGRVRREL